MIATGDILDAPMGPERALVFEPIQIDILPSFWEAFTKHKLEVLKLDDKPLSLRAHFKPGHGRILLDENAIHSQRLFAKDSENCSMSGVMYNYNTIEEFKRAPKQSLFEGALAHLRGATRPSDPDISRLDYAINSFVIFSFADLKKYSYVQWPSAPAVVGPQSWLCKSPAFVNELTEIMPLDSIQEIASLWCSEPVEQRSVFGIDLTSQSPRFLKSSQLWQGLNNLYSPKELLIAYVDPCERLDHPGWLLRNLLFVLERRFSIRKARFVSFRDSKVGDTIRSFYFDAEIDADLSAADPEVDKIVGWGRNRKGKIGPDVIELGSILDPVKLATSAVDLNLQLMKWRVAPSLDLEKIKQTKCLLIGAGTLGCYVARVLLSFKGWGVNHISFVDNGKVSFSNPVRQPLFTFKDCQNGGKKKAEAAAQACRDITPGANTFAYDISVPMAGHAVPEGQTNASRAEVEQLDRLIGGHDAIFLLTDSRESRWLPTLLGAYHEKLVITAALGYDSYVVMRHGIVQDSTSIGCYFCNDIVAPMNSLSDRTLDQMCTVTKPSLAPMASACAVELMTSVLQSPLGAKTPATSSDIGEMQTSTTVPHQIRGSMSMFSTQTLSGVAYDRCTACSRTVQEAFRTGGFEHCILPALNDPQYLENLTGLTEMKAATERIADDILYSSDDSLTSF